MNAAVALPAISIIVAYYFLWRLREKDTDTEYQNSWMIAFLFLIVVVSSMLLIVEFTVE